MKKGLVVLISLALVVTTANAYVMDWTGVNYTAGATHQVFTNVNGSGIDMDFQWVDGSPGGLGGLLVGLPNDEDGLTAYPGAAPGLWYATGSGNDVSLVITFSQVVSNVSFDIYDIDGIGRDKESVRIKGSDAAGVAFPITNYWSSTGGDIEVVNNPAEGLGVKFINHGTYDVNPGALGWERNMATVGIDGSAQIKKIGIAFLNNDGERGQILTNINFVPEPATMALLGLGIAALRIRRK